VQEGEVTVREGTDTEIRYKRPYQSPPQLVLVELRGATAVETLYSKDDFQIVRQDAKSFRVRNNHAEHGGTWATIKWRADGTLAKLLPNGLTADSDALAQNGKISQEVLIERIKSAGGKVTIDPNPPKDDDSIARVADPNVDKNGRPGINVSLTSTAVDPRLAKNNILTIDLHRTNVTDADLAQFERLTELRLLNLYGTKITDAGLKSLSGLRNIQTLYLSGTAISDAGLQNLQGMLKLSDLGLNQTGITDVGLNYLHGLNNLHSLSLSGTKITDTGLAQLKVLRNLKHINVTHTAVTAAGIQALKTALPNLQIIK
jgi:hypothetical protein